MLILDVMIIMCVCVCFFDMQEAKVAEVQVEMEQNLERLQKKVSQNCLQCLEIKLGYRIAENFDEVFNLVI